MPQKKGRPAGPKKVKVQVYIPEELHRKVEERARKGYRSISDQIWKMLDLALEHEEDEK